MREVAGRRVGAVLALVVGVMGLAGCTSDPVDPGRAGTVVVSADLPFASLNGATAAGRAPGSTLVRGLVQSGFTALAPDGTVTTDPSFGTVEKVADEPLTIRYTIAPTAVWSDGVPVTPADLVLEWAARAGQLDEVVAELDADGQPLTALDDVVAFGATSAALVHASAVPTVEGETVTVVYDRPVADWQVALDVNLPAHVVGRLALDPDAPALPAPGAPADATPTATSTGDAATTEAAPTGDATPTVDTTPTADATPTADSTPTADATDGGEPDAWARAVVTAVQQQDRDALVALSRVWRAAGRAAEVSADPTLTTTTGPYVLARVDATGVEVVRNEGYRGDAAAAYDRVHVRSDLDPLAQVEAVGSGDVDVAAPISTADVLAAAEGLDERVAVRTGGDAVLQLVLQESAGGVFDPASHATADDPAATAADVRRAFLATVPREQVVAEVVQPLWARAEVSDVVTAPVGPDAPARTQGPDAQAAEGDAPTTPVDDGPLTVRVLTNTADPLRAAAVDLLTDAAGEAGFEVVPVDADDPAQALRTRAEDWDAALVPVAQDELPVAGFAARWRSGGATNVTGHADPALDAVLDALVSQPDAAAAEEALATAAAALRTTGAVLPVVRTPALTVAAVRDPERDAGLPRVADVPVLQPAAADLTWWWGWTRQ